MYSKLFHPIIFNSHFFIFPPPPPSFIPVFIASTTWGHILLSISSRPFSGHSIILPMFFYIATL
jgi:hypothetical protein